MMPTALLLGVGLIIFGGRINCALAADASGQPVLSEEQIKLKEKWRKALTDAQREFQSTNDRESAEFVARMLAALDRPDGLEPAALAAQGERMKKMTRDLVRRGALESAAALNWAQNSVLHVPGPGVDGPSHPPRPGGPPGPGGLVLYLSFDAPPDNGLVRDESSAGNHGRVEGAQWVPEGRFGGACQFRITNLTDRIVIPDSDSLDVQHITLTAWIKTSDQDGFWNRILDKDYRKSYNLCLGGDINGKGNRGKFGFEANGMWIYNDRSIGDGQWHHVVATFDGQVNVLFLDGVEQKRKKATRPGPLPKDNWDICIGNSVVDYGTGEFLAFDGLIDEVRIYNRALAADEIKKLAAATQAGTGIVTPAAAPPPAKPETAERLKQLKSLYDQGLISREDYDRKVKEILDPL
jgi:hypothetical protein